MKKAANSFLIGQTIFTFNFFSFWDYLPKQFYFIFLLIVSFFSSVLSEFEKENSLVYWKHVLYFDFFTIWYWWNGHSDFLSHMKGCHTHDFFNIFLGTLILTVWVCEFTILWLFPWHNHQELGRFGNSLALQTVKNCYFTFKILAIQLNFEPYTRT